MLITDNHNPDGAQGMLLSSEDGLFFDYYQGQGYGLICDYIPDDQLPEKEAEIPEGMFERPQLLLKDGIPTHLYTPCLYNRNTEPESRCYLFSISNDDV